MIVSDTVRLNIGREILSLNEGQELTKSIQDGLESLLERAPSDCFVALDVLRTDGYFHVDVSLASGVLSFMLRAKAHSPFVALERVLTLAWDKVQVWSISKQL